MLGSKAGAMKGPLARGARYMGRQHRWASTLHCATCMAPATPYHTASPPPGSHLHAAHDANVKPVGQRAQQHHQAWRSGTARLNDTTAEKDQ